MPRAAMPTVLEKRIARQVQRRHDTVLAQRGSKRGDPGEIRAEVGQLVARQVQVLQLPQRWRAKQLGQLQRTCIRRGGEEWWARACVRREESMHTARRTVFSNLQATQVQAFRDVEAPLHRRQHCGVERVDIEHGTTAPSNLGCGGSAVRVNGAHQCGLQATLRQAADLLEQELRL